MYAFGSYAAGMPGLRLLNVTCANCQLLCHPERDERKRRYKLLTKGGVVVQNPDGSLEALTPKQAEKRLVAMSPSNERCTRRPSLRAAPKATRKSLEPTCGKSIRPHPHDCSARYAKSY